tara:strand:+ start:109 stop:318 length:210 start_codon:yes stop_codon:yes gene_type:complete
MGEAKRRKNLGLPPKNLSKFKSDNKNEGLFSWFPMTRAQYSKYPYLPVVTMALGLILLLVDWNNFNQIS